MQTKADTSFDSRVIADAHVVSPVGAEPRRSGWMAALIALLAIAVIALGANLAYPAVTTSTGEGVMNRAMDAWNSGSVAAFRDVYAPNATMTLMSGETYTRLDAIVKAGKTAQANGFKVERTGPVTETENLIAYPASVTTDTATENAMIVLSYDGAGMILEHHVIWQTP